MTDISPLRMLKSSGSSSRLVFLKNFPYFVSRSASDRRFPSLSFAFVIVRNFTSLNIFSSLPGRSWVKNGLPFISKAPITVNMPRSGDKIIIARSEEIISRIRFMYLYIITHRPLTQNSV